MRIRLLLLVFLLAACGDVSTPPVIPPTPTPLAFTSLNRLLGQSLPKVGAEVDTIGYVLVAHDQAILCDGLSFSADPAPQPLPGGNGQIWVGATGSYSLTGTLRQATAGHYAVVLAHGRLEGPGAYGPGGAYPYQIEEARLRTVVPDETSIALLSGASKAYEGRVVRIAGYLLAGSNTTLLVDQLGSGGIPANDAQQIKLNGQLRDQALLSRLQSASGGNVHFGQVQIEGVWSAGQLTPMAILPVS